MAELVLTERQKKWFATVEANLEKNTGKSLAQWRELMASCPETGPRAQLAWLRTHHGVGVNHGSHILDACRPKEGPGWNQPEALRAQLWSDDGSRTILEAIERIAAGHADVISGQRKGYTAFSRAVQFAATRPLKGGRARLGLKLDSAVSPRLSPTARKESWSERLIAVVDLDDPAQVDAEMADLFAQATGNG